MMAMLHKPANEVQGLHIAAHIKHNILVNDIEHSRRWSCSCSTPCKHAVARQSAVPACGDGEAEGRLEHDVEQRGRPPVHVAQQRAAQHVGRHA